MLKYAYFPGCASKAIEKEYNLATKKICAELKINLVEIPEFSCCGAGLIREKDHNLNKVINARNFALAEEKGLDIATICATCLLNLKKDLVDLNNDKNELNKTNEELKKINLHYRGSVNVKHLLWILAEDFGFKKIAEKVKKPLKGLKIAPFYGCHLLRPEGIVGGPDDSDNPHLLEKLIRTLGGEPISIPERTECCGFHIVLINEKPALKMSGKFLSAAKNAGAEAVITVCPFCHMAMDAYQPDIERITKKKLKLPVLHFTQLIGIALGLKENDLGLAKHIVSPKRILTVI